MMVQIPKTETPLPVGSLLWWILLYFTLPPLYSCSRLYAIGKNDKISYNYLWQKPPVKTIVFMK